MYWCSLPLKSLQQLLLLVFCKCCRLRPLGRATHFVSGPKLSEILSGMGGGSPGLPTENLPPFVRQGAICLAGRLAGRRASWPVCSLVCWLPGRTGLPHLLTDLGRLACWLGPLAGLRAGWLAGWLAFWLSCLLTDLRAGFG